jgi:hypothetical protein
VWAFTKRVATNLLQRAPPLGRLQEGETMKRLLLLTTLSLMPSMATANTEDSVQQLYSMSRLPTSDPHSAFCAGFIAGIGVLMWSLEPAHTFAMCADGSLSPSPEAMRQGFEANKKGIDNRYPGVVGNREDGFAPASLF